ncbi:3'5'-cyclic nucleotide phosphodiesterase family protein [Tritrichomonas foetus]|uniref:3'5'-cyclic nucleotide phosphodiesterase family protein n=1 Tax=Tritrichomonas foetus TaxID=1144522 RepID=A0A1J4KCR5_9EUKA|nr:3'5'-cyclic nucleotide phosphodiesterase family protein [Tritrichomonas foetus]|eukprot:OHT07438.1 3'5'-cyclic nucleotide phosphodiesterase family protein [Tritrichomonas foetus]
MASIKVLKKIHQQAERRSLVKDLIALRPISPVVTKESHPLEVLYNDSNPPPPPIDQFAPYLSRKLSLKRSQRIEKMKNKRKPDDSMNLFLTKCDQAKNDGLPPLNTKKDKTNSPTSSDRNTSKTSLSNPIPQTAHHHLNTSLQAHLKMEDAFDKIASGSATTALHCLIETTLQVYFLAEKVLFFHDISSVKVLYCPSTTAYCPHGIGITGFVQFSRQIVRVNQASSHISYSLKIEGNMIQPDSQVLIFPVYDSFSTVKGVIAITRNKTSPPFTDDDEKFAEYFQNKCQMYSRWLFQPGLDDSFVSDLMKTYRLKQFVETVSEKLSTLFCCRSAEVWRYNTQTDKISVYRANSNKAVDMSKSEAGIAGFVLRQAVPVSCISARVHSAYHEKTDGNGDYSCLSIPVRDPDNPLLYAVILRGKRTPQFFTDNDEKILARVIPYVISSLTSAEIVEKNHRALKDSMHQQKRLRALLEVAEYLSCQLKMDDLIPNIMARACELVKSDRCSLFIVNETHDKLVTTFMGGLANAIEIPINAGIVGYTATTGEILNIQDAYEDKRFNKATDLATGYRTLTILSVPIFDEQNQICGVTEMINKLDGVFTAEDESMIKIFNVFCGISLENARLYRASIDLSLQLRSFLEISYSLSQPQTIKKCIEEILKNSRKVMGAVRAALFMIENNGINFTPYVLDEDIEAKIAKTQQKKQEEMEDSLGVKRAIIAKLMQGKSSGFDAEAAKEEEARNKIIEQVIGTKESFLENYQDKPERSMICVPILSSDRAVMGAVLMQWKKNKQKFTFDEQKLLESYSVFLSISLERSKLKNIAMLGASEVEIQMYMNTDERDAFKTPEKLLLSDEQLKTAISRDFSPNDFKEIGLVKEVFYLFDLFGLQDEFKISNEMLFHFLCSVKETYNQVPYHNWIHAIDVTQFMAHQIHSNGLMKTFTKFEIFALLVSSICHDANHDGFSNQYNVKAQTPLGILFRNQSVMETHHCTVMINILTRDESNMLHSLDESEITKMWALLINLILSTDMAKHFQIVEQGNEMLAKKRQWQKSEKDRLLVMELMIKTADISNVSRRFDIANLWCTDLCEEFFRQGDFEKASGMECSPMNDREHLDVEKSQIAFYHSVCLPLFELDAKIMPGMKALVEQVTKNMAIWERRLEEKHKQEEEEAEKKRIEEEKKQKVETVSENEKGPEQNNSEESKKEEPEKK